MVVLKDSTYDCENLARQTRPAPIKATTYTAHIAKINYLILSGRLNKGNSVIKSYILCLTVKEGER